MAHQGIAKFKWLDHLNGAWVTEDCEMIASRRDALMLFERLVSNTEVVPLPQQVSPSVEYMNQHHQSIIFDLGKHNCKVFSFWGTMLMHLNC